MSNRAAAYWEGDGVNEPPPHIPALRWEETGTIKTSHCKIMVGGNYKIQSSKITQSTCLILLFIQNLTMGLTEKSRRIKTRIHMGGIPG